MTRLKLDSPESFAQAMNRVASPAKPQKKQKREYNKYSLECPYCSYWDHRKWILDKHVVNCKKKFETRVE